MNQSSIILVQAFGHILAGGLTGAAVHWCILQAGLKLNLNVTSLQSGLFNEHKIRTKIEDWLAHAMRTLRDKKRRHQLTAGDLIHAVTSAETFRDMLEQWQQNGLKSLVKDALHWLWNQPFWDRPVKDFYDPDDFRPAALILLDGIRNWLSRPESRGQIEALVGQVVPQFSGLLGPLAAMFLNPGILTDKLMPYVLSALNHPKLADGLAVQFREVWQMESEQSLRAWLLKVRPDLHDPVSGFDTLATEWTPKIPVTALFEALHDFPVDEEWISHQSKAWGEQVHRTVMQQLPGWTEQFSGGLKEDPQFIRTLTRLALTIGAVSGGIIGFVIWIV